MRAVHGLAGLQEGKDLPFKGSMGFRVFNVLPSELLPVRGPYFDIRGLVFTTSMNHAGEQAEIVALGKGPKGKLFYCVKFTDESKEWLSEDDVFLEVGPSS